MADGIADPVFRAPRAYRLGMDSDSLHTAPVPDLLKLYAAILQELRRRDVVRTGNAPAGDYAEYLTACVYGGELVANSVKSYDLDTADGIRVQVKARVVGPDTKAGAIFSVFRSFDFDVAVLIAFDHATYDVLWAREVPAADIEAASAFSSHVNGHRVRIAAGKHLGTDVTARFTVIPAS